MAWMLVLLALFFLIQVCDAWHRIAVIGRLAVEKNMLLDRLMDRFGTAAVVIAIKLGLVFFAAGFSYLAHVCREEWVAAIVLLVADAYYADMLRFRHGLWNGRRKL